LNIASMKLRKSVSKSRRIAGYYNELRTHLTLVRIRRAIGRSNGSASSLLNRSSADFIINTAGSSSRPGQRAIAAVEPPDAEDARFVLGRN
jgi:hypothetical protein